MASTLSQVRAATFDLLRDELASNVNVYASPVDAIYGLSVIVMGFPMTPQTFDDGTDATMTVVVATPIGDDLGTFDDLVDPLSDTSVVAALRSDPTLGGTVDSSNVVEVSDYERAESGGSFYISAEIRVEVMR